MSNAQERFTKIFKALDFLFFACDTAFYGKIKEKFSSKITYGPLLEDSTAKSTPIQNKLINSEILGLERSNPNKRDFQEAFHSSSEEEKKMPSTPQMSFQYNSPYENHSMQMLAQIKSE